MQMLLIISVDRVRLLIVFETHRKHYIQVDSFIK